MKQSQVYDLVMAHMEQVRDVPRVADPVRADGAILQHLAELRRRAVQCNFKIQQSELLGFCQRDSRLLGGVVAHTHDDYDRFVEVAGPGQWNDAVRNTRLVHHSYNRSSETFPTHVCLLF